MSEVINCPECGFAIELDKALAKKLEANLDKEYKIKLGNALHKAIEETKKDAEKELGSLRVQLDLANSNELALRKQKTELEQKAKDIDLEVQRRLDREKEILEARVGDRVAESYRLKDAEKDKKLADALAQAEEMKRKIEMGSQQSQGEVLEVELETIIRAEFPFDAIEPVAKGVKGGDILHIVRSKEGEEAGKILWEMKRTKSFSESWIAKLKNDARSCKASICILATETMPSGIEHFHMYEGVWITPLKDCVPLSRALRFGLTQVAREKIMQSGRKEKAEVMYDYLISQEFKGRIEAIVEGYRGMKEDLESERRAMEKIWAKREKQINLITFNLAGMHGEMEALAGDSLPNVKLLEMESV